MEQYLSDLNEQQRDAVVFVDAPSLVIAGAGSGKTRVLTRKIVHLLRLGLPPQAILALTFTNKAAREMRNRVESSVGSDCASRIWMGTFHSIFARILRIYASHIGFRSDFTIYDSADSKAAIKMIIKQMGLDVNTYKPAAVAATVSRAKNLLVGPAQYASDKDFRLRDEKAGRPMTARIYQLYSERCRAASAMDFDDLLYYMNVLMRDQPEVCDALRRRFKYILVDEYQDTNLAQHSIIRRLTEGSNGLTVVGDDAQSIYSFRGANISNILALEKQYPGLRTFKLETNYRSTTPIVEAANSLIAKNVRQIPKRVVSALGREIKGEKVRVARAYSDYDEAALVAQAITRRRHSAHDSLDEYAILYRTNAQSRVLEEMLRRRAIPYRIYGGLSFYQRKEVRDAIAYFRLILNPDDDEALRRVINFPARGIGDTTVGRLATAAMEHGVSIGRVISDPDAYQAPLTGAARKRIGEFVTLMESLRALNESGADAYTIAVAVMEKTRIMQQYVTERTPENVAKVENLEELMSGIRSMVDMARETPDGDPSLAAFMADVALATDQDSVEDADERVTLMTVHAAKGLEFNNVFIVGLEEDLFPSNMGGETAESIEEERRLLYVAITRARRYCMITYAGSRFRSGQTVGCRPSRFLGDIDSEWINFEEGSRPEKTVSTGNPISNYRRSFAEIPSTPKPSFTPLSATRQNTAVQQSDMAHHKASELTEGMSIVHSHFGRGTIISIETADDPRVTVDFSSEGRKTMLLRFAKFAIEK